MGAPVGEDRGIRTARASLDRFSVVIDGLDDGVDPSSSAVVAAVASALQVDVSTAAAFLDHCPVTVRKGAAVEEAEPIFLALRAAGVRVVLARSTREPPPAEPASPPPTASAATPSPAPLSPPAAAPPAARHRAGPICRPCPIPRPRLTAPASPPQPRTTPRTKRASGDRSRQASWSLSEAGASSGSSRARPTARSTASSSSA